MSNRVVEQQKKIDREEWILDAVIALLSQHGISGVSMRAVAREAGVALGLVNYYYADKVTLVGAALRRIEEHDVTMVEPDPASSPEDNLRSALHRVADPEFLTTEYLSLRLQLWALAKAHPEYEEINAAAQKRYRAALAALIHSARPDLTGEEAAVRATDVDIIQNGMWLTVLLGLDQDAVRRSVALCERTAFQ
ncbi:TetR/AcrR family transcriptional regulator [Nocardiopsis kunsanensis]|uniref:TetR/AcrR family transcriptional regulator n=1 Tax=Nocardiopsis kunsanensis TaxID=141693 RepID=UPI00187536AD|nr:TetR/AcrR family transcriptional regulator [Nocardiopsis kunsanensis]